MATTKACTSAQIQALRPDWRLFRDGCPGGESPQQVAARADSLIATLRDSPAPSTLLFSSGHFLRMLAARWLGLDALAGAHFMLDTASLSAAGLRTHAAAEPAHPVVERCTPCPALKPPTSTKASWCS